MGDTQSKIVDLTTLERGRVYKFHARNFYTGVYDGKGGFIGIREKFEYRYLFKEYAYEEKSGTVTRPVPTENKVPDWIPLAEHLGYVCMNCGRPVINVRVGEERIVKCEHIPWTKYDDKTGETGPFDNGCTEPRGIMIPNPYLFQYLEELEQKPRDADI